MHNLEYVFLDVDQNKKNAKELRNLYTNKKLNFPTIIICNEKLKNSTDKELKMVRNVYKNNL